MKIALGLLLLSINVFAAHGDYAEAMRIRALLEPNGPRTAEVAEKLVLPVSRGFDQKATQLCWTYAALSMLETNYLVKNPGSKLELSRRAMQFTTMKDRYTRQIHGTENFISERGVTLDAMTLIREAGLVAFADFKDIADPYGNLNIGAQLHGAVTLAEKYGALAKALEAGYQSPPLENPSRR